jgi:hypothetical protein
MPSFNVDLPNFRECTLQVVMPGCWSGVVRSSGLHGYGEELHRYYICILQESDCQFQRLVFCFKLVEIG